MSDQHLSDSSDIRKFFAMIPHIADDDLDLWEYRLYGHYLRVCGTGGGSCHETENTTAKACGMGRNKMRTARASLADKGFIDIVEWGEPNRAGRKGKPTKITLADMWMKNHERFSKRNGADENSSIAVNGAEKNSKCSSQHRKKNLKKEYDDSDTSPEPLIWRRAAQAYKDAIGRLPQGDPDKPTTESGQLRLALEDWSIEEIEEITGRLAREQRTVNSWAYIETCLRNEKKKREQEPNAVEAAIITVFKYDWHALPDTMRQTVMKAARELIRSDHGEEIVPALYEECVRRNWSGFSPIALLKVVGDVTKAIELEESRRYREEEAAIALIEEDKITPPTERERLNTLIETFDGHPNFQSRADDARKQLESMSEGGAA